MEKQITYYLTLSQTFPATHPRKGEPTYFKEKLHNSLLWNKGMNVGYALNPSYAVPQDQPQMKLHTIRANYPLWKKRFEQILRGEAVLSIRQWSGKPYASKQIEIARLTTDDGIGIQKLEFKELPHFAEEKRVYELYIDGEIVCKIMPLATNDGLSYEDWIAWFEKYDKSKPLAIIHFTSFRY